MFKQSKQFYLFSKKVQLLLVLFQYVKKFTFVFFIFILNFFLDMFFLAMMSNELANILFMLLDSAGIA